MLVLKRKTGESIYIDNDIKIDFNSIKDNVASVGITAPRSRNVRRGELRNAEPLIPPGHDLDLQNLEALAALERLIEDGASIECTGKTFSVIDRAGRVLHSAKTLTRMACDAMSASRTAKAAQQPQSEEVADT